MCDYQGRLIAWLDHELADNEAADLEHHVRTCAECRKGLALYKEASLAFDAYCDAVCDSVRDGSQASRRVRRSIPIIAGAGAAAAIAFLLMLPHRALEQPRLHPQAASVAPALVSQAPLEANVVRPIHRTRRKDSAAPVHDNNMIPTPAEPAIEIAIPAEAMFPPGAIPEGVNFTADVSIEADGSVQRLRLRPRLAGFERRPTQP